MCITRWRPLPVSAFDALGPSGRRYTQADLPLAQELARRAALAVDNARLYGEVEKARAEAERRAAELDAAVAAIPDGFLIYGPAGEILRMNDVARRTIGLSREELALPLARRMAVERLETPEGRPYPVEELPMARALRGETVRGAVFVVRHLPGKPAWVSTSAAPIRAADGRLLGAVATFVDVTARHELEEQREDFVRAVSHDLRSPLAAILGQAQLLLRALDRAGLTGRERASAQAILTSAQRMDTMIQDLVDSVRLEAGRISIRRRAVDERALILDLLVRLATSMETGRVRLQAPQDLPPVLADPDHLERIVTNLLSNALKYSPPQSEVVVTLERRDGEVVTAVTDRGAGIAPEDLPHIFERYYQTRIGRREGLGLGLYITKKLVEALGGRIWVESELGKGSTFYFTLPGGT